MRRGRSGSGKATGGALDQGVEVLEIVRLGGEQRVVSEQAAALDHLINCTWGKVLLGEHQHSYLTSLFPGAMADGVLY